VVNCPVLLYGTAPAHDAAHRPPPRQRGRTPQRARPRGRCGRRRSHAPARSIDCR